MTKVEIANMALGEIGSNTISSLEEPTPESKWANVYIQPTIDYVLQMFEWPFAIERQKMSQLSESEHPDYQYAYTLPKSPPCLRFIRFAEGEYEFVLEGETVFTDISPATAVYIKKITDVSKFDSLIASTVSIFLASRLAASLKKDGNLANALFQKAGGWLTLAKSRHATEAYGQQPDLGGWVDEV